MQTRAIIARPPLTIAVMIDAHLAVGMRLAVPRDDDGANPRS